MLHVQRENGYITLKAIREFNHITEGIVAGWRDMGLADPEREQMRKEWLDRRAEGRARVKMWKDHAAAALAEQKGAGIPELSAEIDRLCDEQSRVEDEINRLPTNTAAAARRLSKLMHPYRRC
jgi:hypothetical protein